MKPEKPSSQESAQATPTGQTERIESLDTLRGVAILGILVMNIQSFAMVDAAYMNPTALDPLPPGQYRVWLIGHLFFDMKFMTIFSMLFGAGIVLTTSRWEQAGRRTLTIHYRRMAVLLLIGLAHSYGLWYGDILYPYAMCGFIVYWFRKLSPPWLIALGIAALAIGSGLYLAMGSTVPSWPDGQLQSLAAWQPDAESIAHHTAVYLGSWTQQMEMRAPTAFYMQTFIFLFHFLWRCCGPMLIGMGLYKLSIFSAKRSARFYSLLLAQALLIGLPIIAYGVYRNEQAAWHVTYSKFLGSQYNYSASLLVALGWVAAVMLISQRPLLRPLTKPFAAVGRMALTNYLMQTLICTTLFYGHGLGWYGQVDRIGQLGVVATIWILQLTLSPLWFRYFQFGPAEWLWRTLTYLRLIPIRRCPA